MAKPTDEELRERLSYHPPSPEGVQCHAALTEAFLDLAKIVRDICPAGRELSLALTYLETAKFNASAAVARNPDTR